jgi:flagellar motility protein MotE (MotC chaperone)
MTSKNAAKKGSMTREEAEKLYDNLRSAMGQMLRNNPEPGDDAALALLERGKPIVKAQQKTSAQVNYSQQKSTTQSSNAYTNIGQSVPLSTAASHIGAGNKKKYLKERKDHSIIYGASLVISFASVRVLLLIVEAFTSSTPLQATVETPTAQQQVVMQQKREKEEIALLQQLDSRRAELEERRKRLDAREEEMALRDREFAAKLTQIRDLTAKLRSERIQDDKKSEAKIEQLANVYGSMNPPEAASLIEQLDIVTAHNLIKKMPEKRIGQILALMSKERALQLTNMLSRQTTN